MTPPPNYALTNDESMKVSTAKAKIVRHTECGEDLKPVPGVPGKFFCPLCMKTGWPVKALQG